MILRANCKINIGLDVLRRREDGFHDIETLMFPVAGLYDEIEIVRTHRSGISFSTKGVSIDCPAEQNSCVRAFRLMQARFGIDGVSICLDKRIPSCAGLGGGSSDATAVLMGLNDLFDLHLSEGELILLAAELGSDNPFFVRNTPQLCSGRGEIMEPYPLSLDGFTLVIIKPQAEVSTREAYAAVRPHLPTVPLSERLRQPVNEWQGSVKNDFEPSVFAAHPVVCSVKERLLSGGAVYASMSGSGSAVYGIFDNPHKAAVFQCEMQNAKCKMQNFSYCFGH